MLKESIQDTTEESKPWEALNGEILSGNDWIAEFHGPKANKNAHLAAAAKDLLKAAKEGLVALQEISEVAGVTNEAAVESLEAAITKAEVTQS